MNHSSRILLNLSFSTFAAHCRTPPTSFRPFLGLNYRQKMAESLQLQVGEIRPRDSEKEEIEQSVPSGKKPRLAAVDAESSQDLSPMSHSRNKGQMGGSKRTKKRRQIKRTLPEPYSNEDVLWRDIVSLLGKDVVDKALEDGSELDSPFQFHEEVEVQVSSLCSSGTCVSIPFP